MDTTPDDLPDKIIGFKIPRNLYQDLTSQATWQHRALSEEIRLRLLKTLIPSYRVQLPLRLD